MSGFPPSGQRLLKWVEFYSSAISLDMQSSTSEAKLLIFLVVAAANARDQGATGGQDPHFVVKGVEGLSEPFAFDFHGAPNHTYCMVTDVRLQVRL